MNLRSLSLCEKAAAGGGLASHLQGTARPAPAMVPAFRRVRRYRRVVSMAMCLSIAGGVRPGRRGPKRDSRGPEATPIGMAPGRAPWLRLRWMRGPVIGSVSGRRGGRLAPAGGRRQQRTGYGLVVMDGRLTQTNDTMAPLFARMRYGTTSLAGWRGCQNS